MFLTPGVTIERTDTVSRQTIYDLVANAVGGTVGSTDLSSEVNVVVAQSEAPTPKPGLCWWDQTQQLMKVFTDMISDTGCSIWLAVGPDRFDVAMLATEPIPFGAAVQFAGENRKVRLPDDPITLENTGASETRFEHCKVVGFQNMTAAGTLTAPTVASGSWFPCAVQGICWAWYPVFLPATGRGSEGGAAMDSLITSISGLSSMSGISDVRGGLYKATTSLLQAGGGGMVASCPHKFGQHRATGEAWAQVLFFGPRYSDRSWSGAP
jgi:hypothetical protein